MKKDMSFGEKLTLWMKYNKFTAAQLSEETGIHDVLIYKYRSGNVNPGLKNLEKLRAAGFNHESFDANRVISN